MMIDYEFDTELAAFEALNKGYRSDVIVTINDRRFKIYVTTMKRLEQDYFSEISTYGFYQVEPNTIIVEEVTKETIKKTVQYLYRCKYFEKLEHNGF